MNSNLSVVIATLAIGITVAPARAEPHKIVCRGELYSVEDLGVPVEPYYKDVSRIGHKCFFKKNTEAAKRILEECHYRRPCVVEATVLDSGEIVEVHFAKLPGRDMTCRGRLIEEENTGGDNVKIGPCKFTIDQYTGVIVHNKCRNGQPCTVQARVFKDERGLWISHVYSARPGR